MSQRVKAKKIRTIATVCAVLLAVPFSLHGLTGFSIWFSPFLMLNSGFVLKSFIILNILSLFVIIVSFFNKRWYCRFLCPVGWGCDLMSRLGAGRGLKSFKIPEIGKYLSVASLTAALIGVPIFIFLDPLAIFNSFFTGLFVSSAFAGFLTLSFLPVLLILNFLLPDIWCSKICPLGGFQNSIYELRNLLKKVNKQQITDNGRRYFLASGLGLLAAFTIPKVFKPSFVTFLRPPGSIASLKFNTLCIRCGNCIKVCPTDILTHHMVAGNILAWMTPEVCFDMGYCLETCNLCSRVCPTGSITLFDSDAKKNLFMGLAGISMEKCLLSLSIECDKCVESCKYDAIIIEYDNISGKERPVIDKIKCVGCGACKIICPEEIITIEPLS